MWRVGVENVCNNGNYGMGGANRAVPTPLSCSPQGAGFPFYIASGLVGVKGAVPPASLWSGLCPHRVDWLSGIPKIPSVSRASRALRRSRRQRETVRAHEGGKRAENTSQNMTTGYLTHAKLQGRYPFPCASVIAFSLWGSCSRVSVKIRTFSPFG